MTRRDLLSEQLPYSCQLPYGSDKEIWLCNERLLTWDIRDGDTIIVIGGYQGYTCNEILNRYPRCKLYTWEPQKIMYDELVRVLNGRGQAFDYALGIKNGTFPMIAQGTDECSFLLRPSTVPLYNGVMCEFTSEMKRLGIENIAWLHSNIEGYEHILIPYIIKTGWIKKIGQLVISTHGVPIETPEYMNWDWTVENLMATHIFYWRQRGFFAWSQPDRKMIHFTDESI